MNGIDSKQHSFQYTRNWFYQRNQSTFQKYIPPKWAGKPITYLEIGVFQGQSMVWMLQHVLTHPESKAIGIDPWLQMPPKWTPEAMEQNKQRAIHNTEPWRDRCELIQACSVMILRPADIGRGWCKSMGPGKIDLCMIDGEHGALGALDDARFVLPLMKKGGWMLFDDVENCRKKEFHVKDGLKMFLDWHGDSVQQVFKHRYVEAFEVK